MLFPQTENGESVYTYDFTDHDINRISVDATAADITVSHGGDRSYIEIKNYNVNYYRLNEENRAVTFAEIDDVLSMFKFWEGFSFKGMRYVFASGMDNENAHSITVNVADNEDIPSVMIRLKEGDILIDGYKGAGDVSLSSGAGNITVRSVNVGGSFVSTVTTGELSVENVSAVSIKLSTEDAAVSVKNVKCERFSWDGAKRTFAADNVEAKDFSAISSDDASVTVTGVTFTNAKIENAVGPTRVDLPLALSSYIVDVVTQTGNVFINGEKLDGLQFKAVPEKPEKDTQEADENTEENGEAETEQTTEAEDTVELTVQIRSTSGAIELNTAPEPQAAEETEG
jgi:hypothetical protein